MIKNDPIFGELEYKYFWFKHTKIFPDNGCKQD